MGATKRPPEANCQAGLRSQHEVLGLGALGPAHTLRPDLAQWRSGTETARSASMPGSRRRARTHRQSRAGTVPSPGESGWKTVTWPRIGHGLTFVNEGW